MKIIVVFGVVEWAVRTDGCGLDSGNILHALQQLRPKRVSLLACFVLGDRQRDSEIYYAMWLKTERRVLRVPEAFQCQSCASEENDRKSSLHNHQTGPHALFVQAIA